MKSVPKSLKRGTPVAVYWVDISGGEGNPEHAALPLCENRGFYYGVRRIDGRLVLLCARTRVKNPEAADVDPLTGCDIYPLSVVDRVERVP